MIFEPLNYEIKYEMMVKAPSQTVPENIDGSKAFWKDAMQELRACQLPLLALILTWLLHSKASMVAVLIITIQVCSMFVSSKMYRQRELACARQYFSPQVRIPH